MNTAEISNEISILTTQLMHQKIQLNSNYGININVNGGGIIYDNITNIMKKLITKIKKLKIFFFNFLRKKRDHKKYEDMTLIEKWQEARNMFQHYSIRFMYDYGDGYRRTITIEERLYCRDMADYWENMVKKHRNEIYEESNK